MITCEGCKRQIPEENLLLHQMRCVGIASSATASAAASSLRANVVSAATPAEVSAAPPVPAAAAAAASGAPALRCRVTASNDERQLLHEVYRWVPGAEHVRPTPAVRAQKELLLANLDSMWRSPADWVFHHVFGSPTTRGTDGKRSATRPEPGATVFAINPFPYVVPDNTHHWVLWMASAEPEWPDERITAELCAQIDERGGGEFVWYPNPKMSIGDAGLHHVQVFWVPAAAMS